MAQKTGPQSQQQPDRKAMLQQQMEVQSSQSVVQQQGQNFARKNITNMYNQPTSVVGGDNYAMMQGQQQQQFYAQQQQQQLQQMQMQSQQQQQQYIQPYSQPNVMGAAQLQPQFQQNSYNPQNSTPQVYSQPQSQPQSAKPNIDGGYTHSSRGQENRFANEEAGDMQASERGASGKVNGVRGNKNFLKVENADLSEVNRRQQQQQDYQRELQRQIEEKARTKKEEAEKLKREEFLEEQRVQKEQEILRRQIEEETNSKKAKEDQTKQDNQNLRNEKENARKREQMNQNQGGNGSMISGASREFLNEEKKSEGIDERGSLMDFYRKKSSSSNLNSQHPQTPQPPMMLGAGVMGGAPGIPPNMQMNMMGANGFMNPMMYQNPYMMGQPGMGVGGMNPMMMGMMNPMMMQQQMLAKQQAELLPQLYELRLQMQQQQMQMQQQIDLIKNQANMAIDERNKAEQKYQEIKKQYELKQIEEKKYAEQLTEALSKNHPQNPHVQIKKDLDFISPSPAAQNSAFASLPPHPSFGQQQQQMGENRRIQPVGGESVQKQIENTKIPQFGNNIYGTENESYGRQLTPYGMGGDAQGNPYHSQQNQLPRGGPSGYPTDDQFHQDAKQDYQQKMESYGIKSLVSDNKFIPLDILDGLKNKEQNISMSKLGNYGVNESAFNFHPKDAYSAVAAMGGAQSRPPIAPGPSANRPVSSSSHAGKWDIPSINSDITKEIDSLMKRNGSEKAPLGGFDNEYENSYYQQPKNISSKGHKENSAYNPMFNAYSVKPPSRSGSSQSMRSNRDQPFGAAARGVLGDSRAFEQQKQNMATFKTNSEQEGFNLGSDFPDFSLNNNKGGFGGFGGKEKMMGDSVASAGGFKGLANISGLKGYGTTNNQPTLNTNNFDIDKIMQRNEDRLQKLDRFGIPTINEERSANRVPHEEGLDKLDQLLNKFN